MSEPVKYRFASFELDLTTRELRKNGVRVRLQDQPLMILELLLARKGDLVTRDEIRNQLWPADTFVDFDRSVNTAINRLRDALGDEAENPRYVETLPRRGYRFVFPVEIVGEPAPEPPEPTRYSTRALWIWRIAAALFITACLTLYFTGWRVNRDPEPATKLVIAVEPFQGTQDLFAEGLTEKLIARLGHTATVVYERPGRHVDAQYYVAGTVGSAGTKVLLMHPPARQPVWSRDFPAPAQDIARLQSTIAEDVAEAVDAALMRR